MPFTSRVAAYPTQGLHRRAIPFWTGHGMASGRCIVPGHQRYRKFESGVLESGHFGENHENGPNRRFHTLGLDILRIAGAPALCNPPRPCPGLPRKVSHGGVGLGWVRQQRAACMAFLILSMSHFGANLTKTS